MSTQVVYSPLCDTDPRAYLAYLAAVACNGCGIRFSGVGGGGVSVEPRLDCSVDAVHRMVSAFSGIIGVESHVARELVEVVVGVCRGGDASADTGVAPVDGSGSADGLPSGGPGLRGRCLVGGGGGERNSSSGPLLGSVLSSSNGDVPRSVSLPRGPKYERNAAARLRKKRVAAATKGASQGFVESVSSSRGFFDECSDEVRNTLRESRAKMLIAQNKLRTAEVERKIANLDSPASVMAEIVALMETAARAKNFKNEAVAGWVQTVADSLSEGKVSSASGELPQLAAVKKECDDIIERKRNVVNNSISECKEKARGGSVRALGFSENRGFISDPKGIPLDQPAKLENLGIVKPGDNRYSNDPNVFFIKEQRWTGSIPGSGERREVNVAYRRPARRSLVPQTGDHVPKADWSFRKKQGNLLEMRAISLGIVDVKTVEVLRAKRGRELSILDFTESSPFEMEEGDYEELKAVHNMMLRSRRG